MSQTLMVELSDEAYETLRSLAGRKGQTPEAAGAEWLAEMARLAAEDPLEEWIGAFRSDMPGWSLRHHELLGEALVRECDGGNEEP